MTRIRLGGATDPGRHRERNEDAVAWSEEFGYAILADGVGGQNAGDVASRTVVDVVEQWLRDRAGTAEGVTLVEAVNEANRRLLAEANANLSQRGMGSTIVTVLFLKEAFTVAHVGDSRLYRFRSGALEQLTRDHSLVQELITLGILNSQEADHSPLRSIITRALGSTPEIQVDVARHDLRPGDRLLLCSDGLSAMVTDTQITGVLSQCAGPETGALDLVALANAKGGNDNISVILADVSDGE